MEACRQKAAPYGLKFGDLKWLSNSRLSLEAAEYARDKGVYDDFHHAVFEAYFSDGKDIGDKNVLMECASRVGLDLDELSAVLDAGRYGPRVEEGSREARRLGVTAVPSFFIDDLPAITGAVAEERFREALESVAGRRKLV